MRGSVMIAVGGAGLLLHCATANPDCPAGQDLNDDGTACVSIQCAGGTFEGNTCVCPADLVLNDGTCVECNRPVDCPEVAEECKARSCTENICGSDENAPDGTFCRGDTGICEDGVCEPADQCADKDCSDGEECTADLCERSTGVCSNPPVADETPCDVGTLAGLCLEGACLRVALDDSLDPVDDINVDFNRGGLVTVINRVSYPLGDAEDVVSYRINKTSNSFFGRLTIKVNCDDPGPSDFEIFANGQTHRCGELVVNRIITDVSGNTGFVRMTAIGGIGTFVEWELQFLTCQDNGNPCFQ